MSTTFLYLFVILQFLVLGVVIYLSYLERKDLYNRLMSRDLNDYKNNTQKEEPNQPKQEADDEIPLDEAQDLIEEDLNG